jgi:conjugal transfer pilus assembly protein TraV
MGLIMVGCAPKFSCVDKPNGPGCASVSHVYAEIHRDNTEQAVTPPKGLPQTIKPGDPLREPERVLRVWIAPWVDVDGDYHDQSYVYLLLDHGRWFIEKERERIRKQFAPPVTPPVKAGAVGQGASGEAAVHEADVSQVLK